VATKMAILNPSAAPAGPPIGVSSLGSCWWRMRIRWSAGSGLRPWTRKPTTLSGLSRGGEESPGEAEGSEGGGDCRKERFLWEDSSREQRSLEAPCILVSARPLPRAVEDLGSRRRRLLLASSVWAMRRGGGDLGGLAGRCCGAARRGASGRPHLPPTHRRQWRRLQGSRSRCLALTPQGRRCRP
jgi:hypothetical protein